MARMEIREAATIRVIETVIEEIVGVGNLLRQFLKLEELDATIAGVGDEEVIGGIDAQAAGASELAHPVSWQAKRSKRTASLVVDTDP